MLNLLALLFACADPKAAAIATCQAIPQLATDPAGLELLQPLLSEGEYAALDGAEPTLGLQAVGPEGLARLRADTTCVIDEVNGAGGGRWQVKLTRTQPVVKTDGTFGDPTDTALDWQAVKADGGVRIEAGITRASIMRKSIAEAIEKDDYKRVSGVWRAIADQLHDPVLVYDVQAAELQNTEHYALGRLRVRFERTQAPDKAGSPVVVVGSAYNPTRWTIDDAIITFTFETEAGPQTAEAHTGPIVPDTRVEASAPAVEGANGTIKVDKKSVTIKKIPEAAG